MAVKQKKALAIFNKNKGLCTGCRITPGGGPALRLTLALARTERGLVIINKNARLTIQPGINVPEVGSRRKADAPTGALEP